jgi:hypothetical protein
MAQFPLRDRLVGQHVQIVDGNDGGLAEPPPGGIVLAAAHRGDQSLREVLPIGRQDRFRRLAPSTQALAPAGGLVIIENLTPFEAYVDRLAGRRSALVLWSAGFPGRAAVRLIQQAATIRTSIPAWCDVDLGGSSSGSLSNAS